MMNRIKKALVTAVMVTGITVGATVVAPVATAAPAHAVSYYGCYSWYEFGWRLKTACYHDFNWWEESWAGGNYKDGWYLLRTSTGT